MKDALLKLYVKFESFRSGEEGQDLVEYGMLLTMIGLLLISGINGIAVAVNKTFSNISSSLS